MLNTSKSNRIVKTIRNTGFTKFIHSGFDPFEELSFAISLAFPRQSPHTRYLKPSRTKFHLVDSLTKRNGR
jgi:hypothetical protein